MCSHECGCTITINHRDVARLTEAVTSGVKSIRRTNGDERIVFNNGVRVVGDPAEVADRAPLVPDGA